MLPQAILMNALTLLYRENSDGDNKIASSSELIKNIIKLDKDTSGKQVMGIEAEFISDFTNLVLDYANYPSNYSETTLLETLEVIYKDRLDQFQAAEKVIKANLSEKEMKGSISSLRKRLESFYKEQTLKEKIRRLNKEINISNTISNKPILERVAEFIADLEQLSTVSKEKDAAILDEIDMTDDGHINDIVSRVSSENENVGVLTTGWREINHMLQGGFRRRETWTINALQHNYKSGFLQSLFVQMNTLNTPTVKEGEEKKKKPMILYISLEDSATVYTEFMYRYLYYNEHRQLPDISKTPTAEIVKYLKEKLTSKGFTPVTLRVDPLRWTYRDLFDKINQFESEGYEIYCCIVDYLAKLPTTGCRNDGPGGTDVRDLFQKCRSFFSAKNICFITAHQLSTEAKQLIRNGVKDTDFVKEIAGKGYTELSKQIDQIVDGELYIHIAKQNGNAYLTVFRGKHRIPTILNDSEKYAMLQFDPKAPLRETINNETIDFSIPNETESDLFN